MLHLNMGGNPSPSIARFREQSDLTGYFRLVFEIMLFKVYAMRHDHSRNFSLLF
jgi:hypothetical protein